MSGKRNVSPSIHHEVDDFFIDRESRNLTDKSLAWYRQSLAIVAAYLTEQALRPRRPLPRRIFDISSFI